jgi:hypothetical protein
MRQIGLRPTPSTQAGDAILDDAKGASDERSVFARQPGLEAVDGRFGALDLT